MWECYGSTVAHESDSEARVRFGSVRFVQSDSSVRVRVSNSLGSFGSVRNGLKAGFEFGVFGSGSVRFPSLTLYMHCCCFSDLL